MYNKGPIAQFQARSNAQHFEFARQANVCTSFQLVFSFDTHLLALIRSLGAVDISSYHHLKTGLCEQTAAMDADSFGIVLRLLSEDLGSIAAESKGKGREGTTSDAELARILFEDELTQSTAFLADHIMARSIALAVERDGAVIAGFTASEQQAASDHAHACRLAGVSNTPSVPPQAAVPKPCEVSDDLITELIKFNITKYASFNVDDEDDCPAGPSTWPSERDKEKPETKRCEACQEDHPVDTITKVCCGHCYCRECLQELFTASMTDESLFPPRCCRQPIPCGTFDLALPGGDLRFQFLIRKEETESQDRTYCTRTDCNKYIPKVSIKGDVATCTYCKTKTCTHCKSAEHAGACPQDESYQLLVQVAREQGWQQCFSCKRFVELSTGCNHIT